MKESEYEKARKNGEYDGFNFVKNMKGVMNKNKKEYDPDRQIALKKKKRASKAQY